SIGANAALSGSLRQGLLNANAAAGGVIALDLGLQGGFSMTSALPVIAQSITIDGSHSNVFGINTAFATTIAAGASLDLEGSFTTSGALLGPIIDNGHLTSKGSFLITGLLSGTGDVTTAPSRGLEITAASGTASFAGNILPANASVGGTLEMFGSGTQ